jgi:NADH-quinone oxidoreductase subunit G
MILEGGEWKAVDWQTALARVVDRLRETVVNHGGAALGTLVSPHSTLEEMALAASLTRGLGSDNIDFRLRQSDFRGDGHGTGIPWLGMPIAEVAAVDRVLVVGSFLRKDHPLLAQRLRQAAKKGAQVSLLQSVADDSLIKVAHAFVAPPSLLPQALAEIVVAAARGAGREVPAALAGVEPTAAAEVIAASLLSGQRKAILLGNAAEQHAEASQLFESRTESDYDRREARLLSWRPRTASAATLPARCRRPAA